MTAAGPADGTKGPRIAARTGVRRLLALAEGGGGTGRTIEDDEVDVFLAQKGAACVSPTPLFDVEHYLGQLPRALAGTVNPVAHYLEFGAAAGLLPHPIFDLIWLREQVAGRADLARVPPLLAVLEAVRPPYVSPHPLFDPACYMAATGRPAEGVGWAPAALFLAHWRTERAAFSPYFDVAFYYRQNPHLAGGALDPLTHYLSQPLGRREDVNPMFHAGYYALAHKDVGEEDPFAHYLRVGLAEGRLPNPYALAELGGLGPTPEVLRAYLTGGA